MAKLARPCLQSSLKVVNSSLGIVGIAMILYGLWMIRAWQREMEDISFDDFKTTTPWFIYTFLGAGVTLCAISCVGHLAASVANSCCLSCYMMIIFSLLLLETVIGADILLNSEWEKDLPTDPTGRFKDFRDFVESNFETFKWVGLLIVSAQGLSILVAMVLRSTGPDKDYDSDDEYAAERLLLTKHGVQPAPYVGAEQGLVSNSKTTNFWNTKK